MKLNKAGYYSLLTIRPDLEWKIIYVGSANTEQHDQVLESILVGPVPVGVNKFVFEVCLSPPSFIGE